MKPRLLIGLEDLHFVYRDDHGWGAVPAYCKGDMYGTGSDFGASRPRGVCRRVNSRLRVQVWWWYAAFLSSLLRCTW